MAIPTATCPKCGYENQLMACQNDGSTSFRRGPLSDGSTGMICEACNLGFSHTPCQSGCGAMIPATAFGTTLSRLAGGAQDGMTAYQGGKCFIATELYGGDSAQVAILRVFRDQILLKNWFGARFVAAYYRLAPMLVRVIRGSAFLRIVFRALVALSVDIARKSLTIATNARSGKPQSTSTSRIGTI